MPRRTATRSNNPLGNARVSAKAVSMLRKRNRGKDGLVTAEVVPLPEGDMVLPRLSGNFTPNKVRNEGYLHVSDLLHKCMRMYALADRYNVTLVGEPIYDAHGVMYRIGHAVQDYVTEKLMRTRPKELFGRWECFCGETEYVGVFEKANQIECKTCKHTLTKYNEIVIPNDEYHLVGSIDIVLLIDGVFYFIESKSMQKDDFQALVRPNPDHILQATFYWWLAREKGYQLYDRSSVLYTNKGFNFRSPFKEFQIKPSDHIHRLEEYLEEAKALKQARQSKEAKLPSRVCGTVNSPQAKKCQMCTVCFGVE